MYRIVIYGTAFALGVWLIALAAIVLARASYLEGSNTKKSKAASTAAATSQDDDLLVSDRYGGNREAFYGMCVVSIILGSIATLVLSCLYALDVRSG